MKFNVYIYEKRIVLAADIVMKHYKDEEFLNRVRAVKKFNFTDATGEDVADKIKHTAIVMNIKPYKTKLPWSAVIGYAKGFDIFCNIRKLSLSLIDRVQNFYHEPLHLLGFSHDGNHNNEFNQGTVPYLVAKMFAAYCLEKGIV